MFLRQLTISTLLDRIDIHIEVPRVDYEKLSGDHAGIALNRFDCRHGGNLGLNRHR